MYNSCVLPFNTYDSIVAAVLPYFAFCIEIILLLLLLLLLFLLIQFYEPFLHHICIFHMIVIGQLAYTVI